MTPFKKIQVVRDKTSYAADQTTCNKVVQNHSAKGFALTLIHNSKVLSILREAKIQKPLINKVSIKQNMIIFLGR